VVQSLIFTAESTKFKITVAVFPGIFQDESAWLYASYGHAPSCPWNGTKTVPVAAYLPYSLWRK